MRPIVLLGLIGSNPLGALAAFGVLRVCNETEELNGSKLSWTDEGYDDWVACLHVEKDSAIRDVCDVANALANRHVKLDSPSLCWDEDIRVKPSTYADLLRACAEVSDMSWRSLVDYFAAFGSELVVDERKGLVKPTDFHMTSGQQKFLRDARKIEESIRKKPRKKDADLLERPRSYYKTALTGWKYEHDDDLHHLGLDPAAERMYSLRHKAPSDDKKNRCEPAAIWLAIEALPLFPVVVKRRRIRTIGFTQNDNSSVFRWPVWRMPIALDTLRSLLGCADLYNGSGAWPRFSQRGVAAIFESSRFKFGKASAVFRPGRMVFG